MATAEPIGRAPSARPKSWQLMLFAFPLVALATLFLAQWLRNPDSTGLLWRDPMGVRMLGIAVGLLFVGAAVYLGGCLVLNRVVRSEWGSGATVVQVLLGVAWVLFFCMPFLWVVTIGPAAIQIQRNLLAN